MKWLFIALLLTSCGSNPPPSSIYPNIQPGNSHWAMTPGTFAEYTSTIGTGKVNFLTGVITVTSLAPDSFLERVTNILATTLAGSGQVAIARCSSAGGVSVLQLPADTTTCLFERETTTTIGECGDGHILLDPPEPLTTVSPVAGEAFYTETSVINPDGTRGTIEAQYWTVGVGIVQDGFADATLTALIERPRTQPRAYNYLYSGGEMAETLWGDAEPDGTIANLIVWHRVSVGHN